MVKRHKKYAKILAEDKYNNKTNCYPQLEIARKSAKEISEIIVLDSLPFTKDFFGIPYEYNGKWEVFRIILDAFDDNDDVLLDYTQLYLSGYCDEIPKEKDYEVPKTVILTEGKYDSEVLSESIALLYPHMSKLYSFINFSDFKIESNSSYLTKYIIAFSAAGIKNRIIGLYDNDAAGLEAMQALSKYNLPENVRILHLPEIELANSYPTIGSIRNESANINGKACSIELFLGKDVLFSSGNYEPIIWKGYMEKIKTYQGEIKEKSLVQKRFKEKVKTAKKYGILSLDDWNEMQKLLTTIFYIFEQ